MKASHIIPPAVAFVAVIAWNVSRWRSVADCEEQGRVLRERIEEARSVGETRSKARVAERRPESREPITEGPVDWVEFSGRMDDLGEGLRAEDLREMMALNKRIEEMSTDELVAALDEISALDLDPDARMELEELLVDPLVEKDPEMALMKYADRIHRDDDGVGWQMSFAFGGWAKKNPTAASAWFDRQIADGFFESRTLDGQSDARMDFEGELVGVLLDSDPDEAAARIGALPDVQRREALETIAFEELPEGARHGYAELVRSLVPEDERAGSFTHVIAALVPDGGYEEVGQFLDGIEATREERVVSAREAANSQMLEIASERLVTREDVDVMRRWLDTQAPGTSDRVTGEALGDAAQDDGEFGFAAASKLVLEYHRDSGNDDVLVAFLESYAAQSNLDEALPLANHITDVKRRNEVLEQLK